MSGQTMEQNKMKLKQNGCNCFDTTFVNVSSTDKKVKDKHKDALGKYNFEGDFHDGKIFFVRRSGPPANKVYYLFWAKTKNRY